MRLIDADALVDDLEYDVDLDARALDNLDLDETRKAIVQFDMDCKKNAIDLLRNASTIEPKPHWIPCNERLPEIETVYIVSLDENQLTPNEIRVSCAYWLDRKWQYGVLESYEHKMPKLVIEPLEELTVVAWMPLPEPCEGDDHAD